MTREEMEMLSDSELYNLSLQKNEKGFYTHEADMAYGVRYERSGVVRYAGVARKCGKFADDFYYYGCPDI